MPSRPPAARARAYHLFALVFDHPIAELFDMIATTAFRTALGEIEDALSLRRSDIPRLAGNFQQFESDYISMFELGVQGGPACSLHERDHVDAPDCGPEAQNGGDRNSLYHDLLRFYHHFGLRLTDDQAERRLPDHLCCQLEMLSYLCFLEDQAKEPGTAQSSACAQRDFLARHPCTWLPRFAVALRTRPVQTDTGLFFMASASALLRILSAHSSEYAGRPPSSTQPVHASA